ncbi:MAG: TlyA family RNA methyltransferase [Sphaerochaetaceae bacterium]
MKRPLLELMREHFPHYSDDQLKAFVACREVKIGDETCTNINQLYPHESSVVLQKERYVSRGGYKLEKALVEFPISVRNLVMIDAGSSTGGFTDALLQHGSRLVHAIDVGYNQLDYRLRYHQKVVVHERTNIMSVEKLDPSSDAAVADLSFRSIVKAASHILSLTKQKWMIALIKPQFEIEKDHPEFDGVISDPHLIRDILESVASQLRDEGVFISNICESPIQGRKGNREFLTLLQLQETHTPLSVTKLISDLFD